jgi:putative aldouronate transport system permease protein
MVDSKKNIKILKKNKRFKKWLFGDYVITSIFIFLCITMILPFMNLISLSLSSATAIAKNKSMIFPSDFDFRAYKILLTSWTIWRATIVTVGISISYTFVSLSLTLLTGFVLSREGLKGKKAMNLFLIITMLFGGGLVPYYLVLRSLGFVNNIMVHIIPGTLGAYTIFLMRNFIDQIPNEVQESAYLDGANHFQMLMKIIIPLSTPILATLGIFAVLGKWNDWFTSYMFLPDKTEFWLLQNIVRIFVVGAESNVAKDLIPTDNATAYGNAVMIFCTIPIICVYPFCLKYFSKGLYLGAIK